jgi:radical SAM superfamily enzyme YgiQ (UPF0313 family)
MNIMANVVLVEPTPFAPPIQFTYRYAPFALLSVAAPLVEEGYSIKIIDQRINREWQQDLLSAISKETLCVGVTSKTGQELIYALQASELVKKNTDLPVVWGGVHASLLPKQTLENPNIDFVVQGEGEQVFLKLLRALEQKKNRFDIDGLWYKQNGSIKGFPPREFLDVNTLPRIPFDRVDVGDYDMKADFPMSTSRGCPHRCGFCYNVRYCNRTWRAMSAERVLEDLNFYVSKYEPKQIHFRDDNFFVDLTRVRQICRGIIKEGLRFTWLAECRIEYVRQMSHKDLELLQDSGFKVACFGMESGSQRVLDIMKKDITVEDILAATEKLTKCGFMYRGSFVGGYPGAKEEDLDKTIELITRLLKRDPSFSFSFHLFLPFPGTDGYDKLSELGVRFPETLGAWAVCQQPIDPFVPGVRQTRSMWDTERISWLTERHKDKLLKVQLLGQVAGRPLYESPSRAANILALPYNLLIRMARYRWTKRWFGPVPELFLFRLARRIGLFLYRKAKGGHPGR